MQVNTNHPVSSVAVRPDPVQSIQPISNPQKQKKVEQVVGQAIIELSKSKIDIKKQSFWHQHKVKILSAAALLAICSITAVSIKWYDKTNWVYEEDGGKCLLPDPSDTFNHYYCAKSEWVKFWSIPTREFCERVNSCEAGIKMPGCIEGLYHHSLSNECLKNHQGWGCEMIYTSRPKICIPFDPNKNY